jgi:hypothetical protein
MTNTVVSHPEDIALYLYRGDAFGMTIGLWNGTEPLDLTGATARADIRETPDSEDVLATFEASIVDNYVTLTLSPALVADLPLRACWDVEITYADGSTQTIGYGPIAVTADVTR